MRIFRLGGWPLCSCATFHSPFCCRVSLVGHSPISYSLSSVIHSRTFHLVFLIAPCSAVVSGNAWLYSLLNQARVVLAIQGTPHQRKSSNCRWAIVFHFISHTQKSSGDHPVGALKYRFQDSFLNSKGKLDLLLTLYCCSASLFLLVLSFLFLYFTLSFSVLSRIPS